MRYWMRMAGSFRRGIGFALAAWIFSGCGGVNLPDPQPASLKPATSDAELERTDLLRPGDQVTIVFSHNPPKNHEERIKDDGTITPPDISQEGPLQAAGKTRPQLEKELQERYNKYYRNLT